MLLYRNAEIDKIVYGMKAEPDGGVKFVSEIKSKGGKVPEIEGGFLKKSRWSL